jgi:hypothetical protein
VPSKREAVVEELRAVGDDLQSLVETIAQDPKERARRERRWRILYGTLGAVATLAARRAATRVYGVLTGEAPPGKGGARKT